MSTVLYLFVALTLESYTVYRAIEAHNIIAMFMDISYVESHKIIIKSCYFSKSIYNPCVPLSICFIKFPTGSSLISSHYRNRVATNRMYKQSYFIVYINEHEARDMLACTYESHLFIKSMIDLLQPYLAVSSPQQYLALFVVVRHHLASTFQK